MSYVRFSSADWDSDVMVGTVKVYSQIGPISDKEAQYRVAEHARGKAVIEIKPAKPFSMTRGKTGPKPKGWQGWTQGEDA